MKYFTVNYIILDKNIVRQSEYMGIILHTFANISDFKKRIAAEKNAGLGTENIVIKSYKQIPKEAFDLLGAEMV